MPLLNRLERLHAGDVVDKEGANTASEEERCKRVELLLPQGVPQVHLHPSLCPLDIYRWHWDNLADPCRPRSLLKLIKDAPVHQRCLPNVTVTHQDELVVVLGGSPLVRRT